MSYYVERPYDSDVFSPNFHQNISRLSGLLVSPIFASSVFLRAETETQRSFRCCLSVGDIFGVSSGSPYNEYYHENIKGKRKLLNR